jgi:glycosyltransferase involved in cell wall biosynthesis
MRVLLTANSAWNIWNFRRPIVEAFQKAGYRVIILAPEDDAAPYLESLGCEFHALKMDIKGTNPLNDYLLKRRYQRYFRKLKPDVVFSYTIKNNLFGALAAKRLKIPFVPNVTGLGTAFLSSGTLQRIAEALYRSAFAGLPIVFFQNEDDRALFVERGLVAPDQVRLLPGSGIDLLRFSASPLPAEETPTTFLMIARLLKDKGIVEYVEAARLVKKIFPDTRFQILGAIGSENRTAIGSETVDEWIREGAVEYLGTTNDVRPAIEAATCVVLPSYREGAPRTLIEAAAMGRPLIATNVPGCRSVLDHEVTGYLCEVRSAQSLSSAIERFIKLSAEKKEEMGRASREKMEREFSQEIVLSEYQRALSIVAKSSYTEDIV